MGPFGHLGEEWLMMEGGEGDTKENISRFQIFRG